MIEEVERPRFKILSVLHDTYILMEGDDGLVLLEPKAARDRIVYEQVLKAVRESGGIESQGLLVPEVLVSGDRFHVVRPRTTYEELIGLDSIPDWL